MAKRKRYKKASKQEIKILQDRDWVPVSLAGAALPSWLTNIPEARLMAVYGSGTYWDQMHLRYGDKTYDNVIAGYDVFRFDSKDETKGFPVNKDRYFVLNDTSSDDKYLVVGPTDSDHEWLIDLPKYRPEIEITEIPDDDEDD